MSGWQRLAERPQRVAGALDDKLVACVHYLRRLPIGLRREVEALRPSPDINLSVVAQGAYLKNRHPWAA